jgi:hypothetical protein
MGDGVLIYFGYPHAHEDDAERAVRAGLALIEAVGKPRAQEPLQVRIGVATGLVEPASGLGPAWSRSLRQGRRRACTPSITQTIRTGALSRLHAAWSAQSHWICWAGM